MQRLKFIYAQFGNGDIGKGKQILLELAKRLEHARQKHPKEEWQGFRFIDAWDKLNDENFEVKEEILNFNYEQADEELKDVVAVAVRMLNKEYGE